MDPLSVTASIIAVLDLSGKVLEYLNSTKDASKDRTQCRLEILSLRSLLLTLHDHVKTRHPSQLWYTAVEGLAAANGPLDQFKQALETLQTKVTDGGRLKKTSELFLWKFKKEEVVSILGQMERLKTLVIIALEMDHFQLSRAINEDAILTRTNLLAIQTQMNKIQQDQIHPNLVQTYLPDLQFRVDKIQQDQIDAKHIKIAGWISPSNYPAQQSDIIGRREEGTGQWSLGASEFTTWLSKPNGTLFCTGIPGAGKTMLAAIVIDYLLNSVRSRSVGVAYIFCNYKSQEEQSAYEMLAAILKQLVQDQPLMAEPVERLHNQHAGRGTKPSLEGVVSALKEVIAKYSAVYVVVDALDECRDSDGTRRLFLARLRDLQAVQDVRFLTTSRDIPEVVEEFNQAEKLKVRASDEDVRRFVAGQMYRLPRCIQRNPALQKLVQERIPERVEGMFLLARLYIDALLDKTTAKEVKTTLNNLSKGSMALKDAYEDALQRISSQRHGHYELAKKVLSWITYARRPLTTMELCCALAIEPSERGLDADNLPDFEDLLSLCAGLVVLDRKSGVVRLVHYTTQVYFELIADTLFPDAQLHIVSTCLVYLSFDIVKRVSFSSEELATKLRKNTFLEYAAYNWGDHAKSIETRVCELVRSFLVNKHFVSSATQVFVRNSKYFRHLKFDTGLHLAARFGLSLVIDSMLPKHSQERSIEMEKEDGEGRTLLFLAIDGEHLELVDLLVKYGANISSRNGKYADSALEAATRTSHVGIVKLLLESSAGINDIGWHLCMAIRIASFQGDEEIVKVLLNNGAADIRSVLRNYRQELNTASTQGDQQTLRTLLREGVDLHERNKLYNEAVRSALDLGRVRVLRLLLGEDPDAIPQYGQFSNELYEASESGNLRLLEFLLDNAVNVNAQSGRYGNALQAASARGHEAIVLLLLKKGAEVNAQGGRYGNALQGASAGGYEAIVKVLLHEGAEVNAQGGHYSSALQAALSRNRKVIVKLLLDAGAKVNTQAGDVSDAV